MHRTEGDHPDRQVSGLGRDGPVNASATPVAHVPDHVARGVASSPLPAVAITRDGAIRYANDAARLLLARLAPSTALPDRLPFADPMLAERLVAGTSRTAALETTLRCVDGSCVPVTVFASPAGEPVADASALVFLVERERAGELDVAPPPADPAPGVLPASAQGDASLERFDAVLHASPIALVLLDREFKVRIWNPAAERLFGWSAEEVVGDHAPFVPPDLKPQNAELRRRALEGLEGVSGLETRRRRKDGSEVVVATYSTPVRGPGGEMAGVVIGYIDLGARKRLEAELVQAQHLESVGQLAGGVAHEFNNILTAILGYADIARAMAEGDELVGMLDTVQSAARRAGVLTRELLAYSQRQLLRPQILDPGDVVRSIEPAVRAGHGDVVEVVVDASPDAPAIHADRAQLERVLLDLAENARASMPSGGRLTIRVAPTTVDPLDVHRDVPPGRYALITVTDTGVGMDAETATHIFEPFFTTKALGRGTGLGLSGAYGTVRQSGGYIRVASEPGAGSMFSLYFPAATPGSAGRAPV